MTNILLFIAIVSTVSYIAGFFDEDSNHAHKHWNLPSWLHHAHK